MRKLPQSQAVLGTDAVQRADPAADSLPSRSIDFHRNIPWAKGLGQASPRTQDAVFPSPAEDSGRRRAYSLGCRCCTSELDRRCLTAGDERLIVDLRYLNGSPVACKGDNDALVSSRICNGLDSRSRADL